MRKKLLTVYNSLPHPLRSVVASARGYYLRWWRYGPNTEALVEAALERESWSADQWRAYHDLHVRELLHRAATTVPYYRDYWQRRRVEGDTSSWNELNNWPVLTKEALRANPKDFLADDSSPHTMMQSNTSGTSGKPLKLWMSRADDQRWYSLFEARWRRWYGVSRRDPWAIIGGQPVIPVSQIEPPYWVWNEGLKQLYMTPYHISPKTVKHYLNALEEHDIKYIYGYASALHLLAQFAHDQGYWVPPIKLAISDAEPLWPYQRQSVEEAFQCPVHETYGMAEKVMGASECSSGKLHIWPDAGVLEVMHDDRDEHVPDGEAGRFICTGLTNLNMPLIRYEVGDRGALSPDNGICACGRTLPLISSLEGRMDDVVIMPDGRRLGRLSPAFKGDLAIQEAQVIQETINLLRVLVVPASGFSQRDADIIKANIRDRVGNMDIQLETVEQIPRSESGKFRGVISKIAFSVSSDRQELS